MRTQLLLLIGLLAWANSLHAQAERKTIRQGNTEYQNQNYTNAEVAYTEALQKNDDSFEAKFNLGDAFYKQNKYDRAAEQFLRLSEGTDDPNRQARIQHNLGNTFLQQHQYEKAIEAYKNSLRKKPDSPDTKYNLAYAQQKLQQQQQQQNQNKDKNQEQEQKQQDNQQDKQNNDKKDQEQQNQQNQQNQQKPDQNKDKQQNPMNISKENREQMMDALKNKDQQNQKAVQEKQMTGKKTKVEKPY